MRTSAAALELDFTEPSITAAKAVCAILHQGKGIDRPALLWAMETAYGASAADGAWSLRDAYDMLELAQVFYLNTADLPRDPMDCLAALVSLTASLPTHNRILALRIGLQNAIFDEYLGLIEARIEAAREAGTLDLGVESINAERITILDRTVIRRDQTSGAETEILRLETEERYKPMPLERAMRMLGDDARPIVNRKSGKAAIRCSTYSLTDDDGEIVRRYELVRPTRSERMRQDLLLETLWEETTEEEFAQLWQAEVEDMRDKTRTNTLYLVAGLLLPVWGRLPDDHVQVWRLNTDDGQSFLGRIVPAPLVPKLAEAFEIAATITVSSDDTVKHVMTTGEILAVGAYRLKRSLVAGQQRLELIDWPHTRLAELKTAGCFTDIIQHKTRMFVPVATAAAVIARITA